MVNECACRRMLDLMCYITLFLYQLAQAHPHYVLVLSHSNRWFSLQVLIYLASLSNTTHCG